MRICGGWEDRFDDGLERCDRRLVKNEIGRYAVAARHRRDTGGWLVTGGYRSLDQVVA